MNAANPGNPLFKRLADDAAQALGIKLEIIEVKDQSEIADAIDRMGSLGVEGLVIINDPVLGSNFATIAERARIHKLPSVDGDGFVYASGLFDLSQDFVAMARRAAWHADQILKGTAPGPTFRMSDIGFRPNFPAVSQN